MEQFWNGAILDSIDTVFQWTCNMAWKGFNPVVHLMDKVYERGITVDKDTLAPYRGDWHPSDTLPKWAITVGHRGLI
ncbi:MAG: hypothetical protein F6K11_34465 [Leptolyngbya sp. SIO3F4]|nr:hypothetical protein [Leptolyngbya sp. SIO3F4]